MCRVRVHSDPPNYYQAFLKAVGTYNIEAGEDMRYLSKPTAAALGVPVAEPFDWWIVNESYLVQFNWDPDTHQRRSLEVVTSSHRVEEAVESWSVAWKEAIGQ